MSVRRYRRYSTAFKLQLVEAYLAGEGTAKGLAQQHGICHSLILIWSEKYRKGELALDVQRQEQLPDYELKIAALERKVGQLMMELDLVKKGLGVASPASNGSSSMSSGWGRPRRTPEHGQPTGTRGRCTSERPGAEHLLPAA